METVGSGLGALSREADFDVFVSHNTRDRLIVERIAERLTKSGIRPWLDRWAMTPGGSWQYELGVGLESSSACAVFIGAHDLGDWELQEVAFAIDRAAKVRGFRVFPVLLPGVQDPFDPSDLPHFLRARTWVDFRKGVEDSRALQDLINAIKGIPFGPTAPIAPRDDVCPYRGLEVFDVEHAEFFFGRDREIQRLIEKLKESRLLTVLGPSGSGKSSLVRAGLVPALRGGIVGDVSSWEVCILRPSAAPLTALAAATARLCRDRAMGSTLDQLAEDPRTLHLAVKYATGNADGRHVLFVIDQLEEVFTLCDDDVQRQQLFGNLLYAAAAPGGATVVVLTMRADFYQHCAAYPELAQLMARHQVVASPMDLSELRLAIEEPARRVGLEFEEGLVVAILDDVGEDPPSLPLLEHALLELWKRRRGTMMTLEGYVGAGRVAGAIATRADAVFAEFTDEERELARRLLLRLTQPGEGTEDTRRSATLGELVPTEHPEAFDSVLRTLVDARLLTTGGDAADSVDVAHEALIRGWPKLRDWIDADRAGLRVHRRLTDAAGEWQRLRRDESLLYRGLRLDESMEWAQRDFSALNVLERTFLDMSLTLRERDRHGQQRRRRLALAGLAVASTIILLVATVAVVQRNAALDEKQLALARELAVESGAQLTSNSELALLLAVEAVRTRVNDQTADALRAALAATHLQAVLPVSTRPVTTSAYRRDGKAILTAGNDGQVRIWRRGSRRPIATVRAGPPVKTDLPRTEAGALPGTDAAFAGSGRVILTTNARSNAKLWDTVTHRVIRSLPDRRYGDTAGAISADTKYVVTLGSDGMARLWTLGRPSPRILGRPHEPIESVALSPDGLVATADGSFQSRVHLTPVGRPESSRTLRPAADSITDIAFTPDGKNVVAATNDGEVIGWNVRSRRSATPLVTGALSRETFYPVSTLAIDISGNGLLATGRADGMLIVKDFATEGRDFTVQTAGDKVHDVAIAGDSRMIVTAQNDGSARVFAVAPVGRLQTVLHGSQTAINNVVFSPDGRFVAAAGNLGITHVWTRAGKPVRIIKGPRVGNRVTFSPGGKLLAIAGPEGTSVWPLSAKQPTLRIPASASDAAFSPDGKALAVAEEDGLVELRRLTDGKVLETLRSGRASQNQVQFNTDGSYILAVDDIGTLRVWNRRHNSAPVLSHRRGIIADAAFSPDGTKIAEAREDGRIAVMGLSSPRTIRTASIGTAKLTSVTWSPDGRLILLAAEDGRASVLDAARMVTLTTFIGSGERLGDAVFDPSGALVALTGDDVVVRIHRCELCGSPRQLLATARALAVRRLTAGEKRRYLHK
jgi:WD40 repeat protein/energy-coupling factor transporter ATP-binding protein EcfA2